MRNKQLSILTGKQARELIKFGFPNGLDPEVEETLFRLTGRHPYLLQGLLEKLWEIREVKDELDAKAVKGTAREFLREHRDFARWFEAFGSAGHAVYQLLSEAPGVRYPFARFGNVSILLSPLKLRKPLLSSAITAL